MRIHQALYAQLVEHALLEAPKECCGMIACRDDRAVKVFRCTNAAESEYRYEIEGIEQFAILSELERTRLELGAIYHSHTHAEPYPSKLDVITWAYPGALMVIVGVADREAEVRAFHIRGESVREVPLAVG